MQIAAKKGERGNKPYDLERMLRIYLVQNLYNLSDMATAAEVIDSRAFSDFCGVESSNQVPDGDTLGRFRNIVPTKVRITPHAPKHKSNAVSMRNPLYAPKLNMFLLWLSCSFAFERRDTEGCKSKSQK